MQLAIKQLELSEWLEQYPTLQQAHNVIRAHKNPAYMDYLDHIGQTCLAHLDQPIAVERLFGTDLVVGLDTLFEALQSIEAVPALFNDIPVPSSLAEARADLAKLWYGSLDLLTAVRLELAHVMIMGYEQLATLDVSLADRWLNLYRHTVLTYLRQQADQTSLALSSHEQCVSASFGWATHHYLTRFDETGALPMFIMGVASFSPLASHALFDALEAILTPLSQLLRLAQDVAYDPNEVLNTGIFAYASQHRLSLAQAAEAIQASTALQHDISTRLAEEYFDLLGQTELGIQSLAESHENKDWVLAFSQDILDTSRELTTLWKPY